MLNVRVRGAQLRSVASQQLDHNITQSNLNLMDLSSYFLMVQADRGFARSRLCTDADGTTNKIHDTLHSVRNDTSKKGGTLRGLRIKI